MAQVPDAEVPTAAMRSAWRRIGARPRGLSRSHAAGVWIRDLVMPFALKRFASPSAHAWIYTYHIDWDEHAHEPLRRQVLDLT
jgi:hypothetical protein